MIVVSRPDHDQTTNYLKYWSKEIIDQIKKKGISLADLKGKKADKKTFWSYVSKNEVDFVFINGHGSEDGVGGFDNVELMSIRDKKKIKSNVIYARSCRSGKKLGKYLVKNGVKAFIGYDDDFVFFIDGKKKSKPLEDKLATIFLKPSNLIASSLVKGNNVDQANFKSKRMMKKNLNKLLTSENREYEYMARYLYSNLIHQVVWGNLRVSIFDKRYE